MKEFLNLPNNKGEYINYLYLPNCRGNYKERRIPQYIREILYNGRNLRITTDPYRENRYSLRGYNAQRPAYGIYADMDAFKKWAAMYFTEIEDIRYHVEPKDYYVDFTMYDPLANILEKAGLIDNEGRK